MTITTQELHALLRAENSESWRRALEMRFVREVTADSITDTHFSRYLVFEREFVDTAARLAGAAVREAPSAGALLGHSTTLHNLVTEQYGYFTEALRRTGSAPVVSESAQEQASVLTEVVLDAADNFGYPAIVTCMYAAESLYESWCAAAARTPSQREVIADWVRLHVRQPFTAQMRFLEREVDELEILPEMVGELSAVFRRTLEAEIRFHDAAYVD